MRLCSYHAEVFGAGAGVGSPRHRCDWADSPTLHQGHLWEEKQIDVKEDNKDDRNRSIYFTCESPAFSVCRNVPTVPPPWTLWHHGPSHCVHVTSVRTLRGKQAENACHSKAALSRLRAVLSSSFEDREKLFSAGTHP